MKKLILAAVLAAAATSASAGSIAGPVTDSEIIVQQASTSSVNQHILPPAFFVLSVALGVFLL